MGRGAIGATEYRGDIEGLRGVAVLAVVLYHAGLPFLSGGFVGVDVFFVISGYLITGLLVAELRATGRISVAGFYARRARRLLPGLVLMLAACLFAAPLLLAASGELQAFAKSAFATLGFASNFFFWRTQSGYFAEAAASLPLLHTWTLAVEEQFYLVWPLMIAGLAFLAARRRWPVGGTLTGAVAIATAGSFLLSLWASEARPAAAFYLAPARAWEFGLGALLAVWLPRRQRLSVLPAAEMGVIGIAVSVFAFDGQMVWPGSAALLPVLGAAMIIVGGATGRGGVATRLMACRPLRRVGAVSYSWYLWHWPMLAFLNIATLGEATAWQRAGAVAASLIVAAVSHHFVELPIRQQRFALFQGTGRALGFAAACLASVAVVAIGVLQSGERELRLSPQLQSIAAARAEHGPLPAECSHFRYPFAGLSNPARCRLGAAQAPSVVVVWGDSHADHLVPLIDEIGRRDGFGVVARTRGGCRPFNGPLGTVGIGRGEAKLADCARFNAAVAQDLRQLARTGATTVVIASRWPPSGETGPVAGNSWKRELEASINAALRSNLRVILAEDVPHFPNDIPACLARRAVGDCARPAPEDAWQRRQANAVLLELASQYRETVRVWDVAENLCDGNGCRILGDDGTVLFRDSHHLSVRGAQFLAASASVDNFWRTQSIEVARR